MSQTPHCCKQLRPLLTKDGVPWTPYLSLTLPRKFHVLGPHTYLPTLPAGMAMGGEERRHERHPDHPETIRGALPRGVDRQHRDLPGCGVRKAQGRAGD
jgi:hypothetical protein